MAGVHRLSPVLKSYDWGSIDAIPSLLDQPSTGAPIAEAWWGAHATFPSLAEVNGQEVPLTHLLRADAVAQLGPEVAHRWDGALPYLVKVLGVARPLSIQVHPSADQAAAGFAAEESADVPVGGAERSFRDRAHKPELLVALSDMVVLVGFRPLADVAADLRRMGGGRAAALAELLHADADDFSAYARAVLALPRGDDVLAALAETAGDDASPSHRAAAHALTHHPGDPGAMVALALNAVHLRPGQAIYTGDGVVHSYQSGVGLEVMANSDNVVRAGLTSKPIDVDLLCALADMAPGSVVDVTPDVVAGVATYPTEAAEFRLATVTDASVDFDPGPRIVMALDGAARVHTDTEEMSIDQGAAVFVAHSDGALTVTARGRVVVVCAGI